LLTFSLVIRRWLCGFSRSARADSEIRDIRNILDTSLSNVAREANLDAILLEHETQKLNDSIGGGTNCILYSTRLDSTRLYFTVLHCTALHCTALHCTALHCTALHCTALHCTALHCTALHCTALYYTILNVCQLTHHPWNSAPLRENRKVILTLIHWFFHHFTMVLRTSGSSLEWGGY